MAGTTKKGKATTGTMPEDAIRVSDSAKKAAEDALGYSLCIQPSH